MSKHDEKVKGLLLEVEKRKLELGQKPKATLNTNGILKFNDRDHINLNTINDINTVVTAYGYILNEYSKAETAIKNLGIEHTFIFGGYSLEDWHSDFQYRTNVILWNKKESDLNSLQKKLESLVSEDLKTETELDNIEKLLS